VAGEVVGDEVDLSGGIGLLDRLEQSELALGVSGGSGERQRLAVFDPQSTVDPTFSGPRLYSSGALMRWPSKDQPGAGGYARGLTGPSSSRQITVEPSGGSV
jgi:hypothetical protein